ncbi:MAG: hypothetical protein V4797_00530 [Paraburkholderia tropica]|uniref:hypothetical protein n=1 Tax=Paraburkholderia tropica TaxID=92647 RepID=UPI003101B3E9
MARDLRTNHRNQKPAQRKSPVFRHLADRFVLVPAELHLDRNALIAAGRRNMRKRVGVGIEHAGDRLPDGIIDRHALTLAPRRELVLHVTHSIVNPVPASLR